MFWGKVFTTGVYVDFARHFLPSEIPRWRTYIGSSCNFATENDTKVISAATAMFQGTPDPLTLAPTQSDYVEHHQVQTGSSNNLAKETDIDAISVAIPMFWG